MRAKRTREEWAELIGELEASGQSLRSFCAKHGIRPKTFSWWRWQLSREGASKKQSRRARPQTAPAVRLLPVEVSTRATPAPAQLAILVGAVELRFPEGTNISYVGELVGELRSRC